MGVNDREQNKREDRKVKRIQAKSRRASQGAADWAAFDWLRTVALVRALVSRGGCLRIGQTRDGGAWALGVYLENDYATEYIRPSEDFSGALAEIAEAWGVGNEYVIELEHILKE